MLVPTIQAVTWNVARQRAPVLDALVRIAPPDLATLQEVTIDAQDEFRERLVATGLKHIHYSGRTDVPSKHYGNIIASRWPLDAVQLQYSREELPWPQLLAQVTMTVNGQSIVVITAHIPNGSNNGWEKIDTFQVLAKLVRQAKGRLCIVTGDLNEPQFTMQDGHVVTWGQEQDGEGRFACWDEWEFRGRTGTGARWDAAVRRLFENNNDHGLRHAYWEAHGHGAMDVSHSSRGKPRWFDHMFVSTDFRVESCVYLHALRAPGLSDHSALTARLVFNGLSADLRP